MAFDNTKEATLTIKCDTCGKPRSQKAQSNVTRFLFNESRCVCLASELPTSTDKSAESPSINQDFRAQEIDPQVIAELGDRYEILMLLGKGGMGCVYKVRDKILDKLFAVKVLKRELVEDAASVKRFEQEAKAVSGLTHPNLVAVYEYGTPKDGCPFIVMDYLDGDNLAQVLQKEGFLDVPRAIDLFAQLTEAMAYAHNKGVVHRDIKPTNIIIVADQSGTDFAKLVDFGIAKVLTSQEKTQQQLTQTGEVFGSPLYMSPEQGLGVKLDGRSDIYSFGCVMYECLTGAPPFSGLNPIQTIMMHINDLPPPMEKKSCGANIPDDLETVTRRCLEKDPLDRYQTADELLKDLLLLQEGKHPIIPKTKPKNSAAGQKRNRTVALIVSLSLVVLGFGSFITTRFTATTQQVMHVSPATASGDARDLDNLSYKYFVSGQYEKAIPLLQFGVQAYKDSGGKEDAYLADNLQHIGKCYLKLNKSKQAARYYKKSLRIYRKIGNYSGSLMPECFTDYAQVLKNLNDTAGLEKLQQEEARLK